MVVSVCCYGKCSMQIEMSTALFVMKRFGWILCCDSVGLVVEGRGVAGADEEDDGGDDHGDEGGAEADAEVGVVADDADDAWASSCLRGGG